MVFLLEEGNPGRGGREGGVGRRDLSHLTKCEGDTSALELFALRTNTIYSSFFRASADTDSVCNF